MKIIDLKARCVAIPLDCQLRHNTGVHPGYFLRTILELVTDEGLIGLGEVGGGDQRAALVRLKPRIVGLDPFHLETIKLKVLRSIYYLSNARLYGALEIACLDLQGKALGRPMSDLLGGAVRDRIALMAELSWRYDRPGGGDDTCAEDLLEQALALRHALGVGTLKMKGGVVDPDTEIRVMELCRERLGPSVKLRLGAVDVVLTDLHYWEGPRGVKDLCAVLRTFNIGVGMHSGAEFGVELAAMLHTAATIPEMHVAGDTVYNHLADDIIVGGKFPYENGCIRVPTGPGLGVALDEDKMARYERYYESKGDYYARFHQDPRRPDWYPIVGGL